MGTPLAKRADAQKVEGKWSLGRPKDLERVGEEWGNDR